MFTEEKIGPLSFGRSLKVPGNQYERTCNVDLWREFEPEVALPLLGLRRVKGFVQATRTFPSSREIFVASTSSRSWAVYFCYAPDGVPRDSHRFTVEKLRSEGFAVLIVCATPEPEQARQFLNLGSDGVIWKELRGYDFSGYTIGLSALAQRYDSIDVLVLNDSVLGPFQRLRPLLCSTPWDLTGFMTSYSVEHHIVSFAFYIKGFGRQSEHLYRRVFFRSMSFNSQGPVSLLQETRLASALHKSLSVGSILVPSPEFKLNYYLLGNPKGLLDIGFPFIKESIFTKFANNYDQQFYQDSIESMRT